MRDGHVNVTYQKAHPTVEEIQQLKLTAVDVCGNSVADALAARGAAAGKVPFDLAVPALWHRRHTMLIQTRMVAIGREVFRKRYFPPRVRQPGAKLPTPHECAVASPRPIYTDGDRQWRLATHMELVLCLVWQPQQAMYITKVEETHWQR